MLIRRRPVDGQRLGQRRPRPHEVAGLFGHSAEVADDHAHLTVIAEMAEVRQGVRALGGRTPRPTAPPSYAVGTTLKRKLVS